MTSPANAHPDCIEVGFVARAHGVHGELYVGLHDKKSDAFDFAQRCVIGGTPRVITGVRLSAEGVILRIEGVSDRDSAEPLKGKSVELYREDLVLGEGEYFMVDLIGLKVVLENGDAFGTVTAVIPGFQDRLVIAADEHECELPWVDAFLVAIHWDLGTIVIDPPEGLPTRPISS